MENLAHVGIATDNSMPSHCGRRTIFGLCSFRRHYRNKMFQSFAFLASYIGKGLGAICFAELLGGLVLMAIGIKIFVEHNVQFDRFSGIRNGFLFSC